jgi:hypothetical protein
MFSGEHMSGVIPVLFADNPVDAEAAFLVSSSARKDVDRLQRIFFQPESIPASDALRICKKPRQGEAVFLYKAANLERLAEPAATSVPVSSEQASGSTDGPQSKKPRTEIASETGTKPATFLI